MIVAIERHIERINLSEADYYRSRGALKLQELLDTSNPYDKWKELQEEARNDFILSMENSNNLLDYSKSRYYYESAPLFSTAVVFDSIDQNLLKSGIKSIRKNIQSLTTDIVNSLKSNNLHKEQLIGISNELTVFSSMLYPRFANNGLIPLPALPWEDNNKYCPLTHRIDLSDSGVEKTEIDMKLFSAHERNSVKNIQVKSTKNWCDKKVYDDQVDVIYCSDILNYLKQKMTIPENYRSDGLALLLNSNRYSKPHFKYNLASDYLLDKLNLS